MRETYSVHIDNDGSVSRAELHEYIKVAVIGWSGGGEPGPLMELTHRPAAVRVTAEPPTTRDAYTLKYAVNGARFRRAFADKRDRDNYADVLATQGIAVTCGARRARAGEALQ